MRVCRTSQLKENFVDWYRNQAMEKNDKKQSFPTKNSIHESVFCYQIHFLLKSPTISLKQCEICSKTESVPKLTGTMIRGKSH